MARAVYSVQFLSVAPALPSQFVEFPDNVVSIVRDMDICEVGGTTPAVLLVYNAAGGVMWGGQRKVNTDLEFFQWRGRQVFNPGENMQVQVVSGTWAVQISGYELTLE